MLETKFSALFFNMEIPIDDSIVISHFMEDFVGNLKGESYSRKQINKALRKTLLRFKKTVKDE